MAFQNDRYFPSRQGQQLFRLAEVVTQKKKKIKKGKSLVQVEEVVFAITCMPGIPVSPFSPLIPGGPLD